MLAAAALLLSDWGTDLSGGSTVPGGPLDEIAHFLTTLLVLWALGPRMSRRFTVPALVASVAIDADHIPDRLGFDWLTVGTPRPYTHSLMTILVVLLGGLLWRRRRSVLFGIALGLAIHFARDMAEPESGVALLWPVSYHAFSYAHRTYLVAMGAIAVAASYRCWARRPVRPQPAAVQQIGEQ